MTHVDGDEDFSLNRSNQVIFFLRLLLLHGLTARWCPRHSLPISQVGSTWFYPPPFCIQGVQVSFLHQSSGSSVCPSSFESSSFIFAISFTEENLLSSLSSLLLHVIKKVNVARKNILSPLCHYSFILCLSLQ